jgi:hypothetical protein
VSIPFYTTKVPASQTAVEIQEMLRAAGATEILVQYEAGKVSGLKFRINTEHDILPFSLPCETARFEVVLEKQFRAGQIRVRITREHAERVAWRNLKAWVQAQLALIEIGLVEIEQVMLPYLLSGENVTFYQRVVESGYRLALPPKDATAS